METMLSQLVSIHTDLFVSDCGELLQYSLCVYGLTKAVCTCAGCLVWPSGLSHGGYTTVVPSVWACLAFSGMA